MSDNNPPRTALVQGPPNKTLLIGRWQPLHAGHKALIQSVLSEGGIAVVGIMDTPHSERNPHSVAQRYGMFWDAFPDELRARRIELLVMPWIKEVAYGRDCGWTTRRIKLSDEIEATYSGTDERMRDGGKEDKEGPAPARKEGQGLQLVSQD